MFKYGGSSCPVCSKPFNEKDDIVVCPDCGTPHHRECYRSLGHCAAADKHGTGEFWQPPQTERTNTATDIACPNCGTKSPREVKHCPVCGALLDKTENANNFDSDRDTHSEHTHEHHGEYHYYSGNIPPISPNPFNIPYGGVDPNTMLDDISAKDMSIFIGSNAFYFLPKFKAFAQKVRSFFPNFAAFFFTYMYYFYRKMYGLGFLILAATMVLSLPSLMINYAVMQETMVELGMIEEAMIFFPVSDQLYLLASVFNFLVFIMRVALSIFTNKLYYAHARNKIIALKEKFAEKDPTDYAFALAKKGRTNRKLILIIVITVAALYMLSVLFLSTTMSFL